jgi:dihydrofolate reductase
VNAEAGGRRLILLMSVSLDGFAAHPDHSLDWLAPADEGLPDYGDVRHQANLELLGQAGLIVVGRRAGEDMAPAWQGSESPMARRINELPKVVFSQGLDGIEWSNARVSSRPVSEEIPELKAEGGGDIVFFGGARLGQSLLRERLVDELRLTVHPVALGAGLPLLAGLPEPRRFELVSATVYADGTIGQVLRPAPTPAGQQG